jgi:predicted nucleic acid-binding protein
MVKALFDTNILIDYLNAIPQARSELRRYSDRCISVVTWMEVLVGATSDVETATRSFLATFDVVGIDARVAERSVAIRRDLRIRLPNAIVWATAQVHAMLLVTRNTKDFPADDPGVRVPYDL